MSLDVWFREDVQRALKAALTATVASRSLGPSIEYLAGYGAAVATIASAFGIGLAEVIPETMQQAKAIKKDFEAIRD